MRVAVLFSGGKDSTLALYKVLEKGWKVKYLIAIFSLTPESYMWHYPNIKLTKLQAKAMQIPIIIKVSKGEKEKELKDLKKVLNRIKDKIDGVVSGAVRSNFQKSRIEKICKELGLKSFTPLWHRSPIKLMKDMLNSGFKIMITAVAAEGFDKSWLGREIDEKCLEELIKLNKKYEISILGEGGEMESLVLNMPLFKQKLKILRARKEWDEKSNSGYFIIKKAKLVEKLKDSF